MNDDDAQVMAWADALLARFELDGIEVDVQSVLGLAGRAAHTVVRPAAPVTTYVAGLAAGLAAGTGQADATQAQTAAIAAAKRAIAEYPDQPTPEA